MSDKSRSWRYGWLIPLVMLAIAMLACDEVYVPPPMVDRVEADAESQGRAYARVINIGLDYNSASTARVGETQGYETNDYGADWQRSEHEFAEKATNSFPMTMYGEALDLNGYTVWAFPRPIFRGIFYDDSGVPSTARFQLPDGFVSNNAQGNILYVAMGTQGVLIAKLSGNGFAPDWKLSTKGLDALTPLPLNITNPSALLGIIALILFVPPFALIHAYLLQRVWVYVLPAQQAQSMALKVTAALVVLAIIGSVLWLTSDRIDLYEVLGVLTAITVLVGVTATILLTQRAGVTEYTRNRLAGAAFFVSLIVPGAVAALFAMWWLVFGAVFCYWAYQRTYWRFIKNDKLSPQSRIQRWRADRLAIEMLLIVAVGAVAIFLQVAFAQGFLYRMGGVASLVSLLGFGMGVGGLYFLIRHYSSQRAKHIMMLDGEVQSQRELRLLSGDLWKHTIYWILLAGVATFATFMGQIMAYSWLTSLLKQKPIP